MISITPNMFAIMNMFVHTIMYMYYALTSFKNPLNGLCRKYSFVITIIQIVQMILGAGISLFTIMCENTPHIQLNHFYISFVMYVSYIYLFTVFFIKKHRLATSLQQKKINAIEVNFIHKKMDDYVNEVKI